MRQKLWFAVFGLFLFCKSFSQPLAFQIRESGTEEPLSYAQVKFGEQKLLTDAYGNFAYSPQESETFKLCITHISIQDTCFVLAKNKINTPVHVLYINMGTQLGEVTVLAQKHLVEIEPNKVQIGAELIHKTPTMFGEKDLFRSLQILPQVTGGMEFSSDLHVRGADIGHNLVMVDGIPLFNLSHFYGLFAAIDPGVVKSADFYPGVAPARFNGRLASFLDVNLREGNMNEYHGEVGLGLIMGKARIEGPVIKGKSSIHLSMRRSYVDLLAKQFSETPGLVYSNMADYMLKYQHRISEKDLLIFSSYFNRDFAYTNPIVGTDGQSENMWGNSTGSLRWLHRASPSTQLTTRVYYSRYDYRINDDFSNPSLAESIQSKYNNAFGNIGAGIDGQTWIGRHNLTYGASFSQYRLLMPEVELRRTDENTNQDTLLFQSKIANRDFSEASAYFQDNYSINDQWEVGVGVNLMHWPTIEGTRNTHLMPRATINYQYSDNWNIFGGYGANSQALHHIRFSRIQLPTDMWINASRELPVSTSQIYNLGSKCKILKNWEISIEGYYRPMQNIAIRKEGLSLLLIDDEPEKFLFNGSGETYGIEFFSSFQFLKFNGMISYAYMNSTRQSDSLNGGNPFPYDFLRQHNVNFFLTYQVKKNFNINAVFTYGSGMPYQIAFQRASVPSYFQPFQTQSIDYIPEKNDWKMPDFHVLNLGFDWSKKGKRFTHVFNVDIYNVYFRANPFWIYYSDSRLNMRTGFPFMPSFMYTFKF